MDNASTNDTLMEYIAEDLGDEGIAYDSRQHRLRCNGHIINLAVCALFWGKHLYAERQADGDIDSQAGQSTQELNTWRRRGLLGKFHNIIVYIMTSSQQMQAFAQRNKRHI